MKPVQFTAPLALICVVVALALFSACSTNPAPSVVFHSGNAPTGGSGINPILNRTVSFAIKIPPVPSGSSTLTRRHPSVSSAAASPTPQPTQIYLAPHTGSITITLVAVNGTSLSHPAPNVPPANVPPSCASAGCTVTISGVPAADGVDRFALVTYAGTNATGSIISNGVVDVAVPTSTTTSIGGNLAALSVGGFVASLSLSVTPTTFTQGSPAPASVVVSAKDATGATIVGNALFANPIVLGLSTSATVSHFSFAGGASSASVTMPLSSPVPLHYDGASTSTVSVTATSVDGNGNVVNASPVPLTVSIGPPPSPSPTPTISPTISPRGVSLYVLNGMNNAVEEFPSPAPAATPKREFGPTLALLGCSAGEVPFGVGMVQGITVDAAANAYVSNNPNCNTSSVPPYTAWQFGPLATATSSPTSSFAESAPYGIGASTNLGLDPTSRLVLMPGNDATTGTPAVLRVSFASSPGSLSSVLGGGACIPLIGLTTCDGTNQYSFQTVYTAVVDARGYTYLGSGSDLSGNPVILVFAPGTTSPIVYSAIDGPQSDTELDLYPAALAIDGTTLYVLNPGFGPGFSNCGPLDSTINVCADGATHEYVTAYDTTKLVVGTAVDLKPTFVLGGDAIGRFGSTVISGLAQAYSDRMAARNGKLYIANPSGPNCPTSCASNAANGVAPATGEIDIYNVAGLAGAHDDVAPTTVITNPGLVPAGLAFGTSGSAAGAPIPAIRGIPGKYHAHAGRRVQLIH